MDVNKILNYFADKGRRYLTYVMVAMGIIMIIGLFIPVRVKDIGILGGIYKPVFFETFLKALLVIIFTVLFIVASQLKQFWGAPAVLFSIIVMIVVGSIASKNYLGLDVGGGLAVMKGIRIIMLIAAILNAGLLVFKEFVLDKKAH